MTHRSDLVDVTVALHAETPKAVLVSDDGDRGKAVWIPLSQIEIEKQPHGYAVLTMPEWLAMQKGFV